MPIVFRCSTCQKTLRVGDDAAGKKARCPDCGTIQDVVRSVSDFAALSGHAPVLASGPPVSPPADNPFSTSPASNPFSDSHPASVPPGTTDNPYAAPSQMGGPPYSQLSFLQRRQLAEGKVKGPALAMIVLQVIAVVLQLFQLTAFVLQDNVGKFETLVPLGSVGISLGMSGLILFGAWRMYRMRGYGWAMAAAILSLIPCSGCCILGMPAGIWGLVILNDPIVKGAFD